MSEKKHPSHSEYYAWSSRISESQRELERLGVSTAPQKIATGVIPAAEEPTAAAKPSAWNAAGTWEERDVSTEACKLLRRHLAAFSRVVEVGGMPCSLVIKNVRECDGTASLVHVRGKVKAGFEIRVGLDWELLPGDGAATGAVDGAGGDGGAAAVDNDAGNRFADDDADSDSDDGDDGDAAPADGPASGADGGGGGGSGSGTGGSGTGSAPVEPVASGSIDIPEVTDDCGGDYEVSVRVVRAGGDIRSAVQTSVASCRATLHDALREWVEAMRQL